jgi:hypothetical protein
MCHGTGTNPSRRRGTSVPVLGNAGHPSQPHHGVPHHDASLVHITVRPTNDLCIARQLQATEDDPARLTHALLQLDDGVLDREYRRLDQDGIVYRSANPNVPLGG